MTNEVWVASFADQESFECECDDPTPVHEEGLEGFASPQLTHVLSSLNQIHLVQAQCLAQLQELGEDDSDFANLVSDGVWCEEPTDSPNSIQWNFKNGNEVLAMVVARRFIVQSDIPDASKSCGVTCCTAEFPTAREAEEHESHHSEQNRQGVDVPDDDDFPCETCEICNKPGLVRIERSYWNDEDKDFDQDEQLYYCHEHNPLTARPGRTGE